MSRREKRLVLVSLVIGLVVGVSVTAFIGGSAAGGTRPSLSPIEQETLTMSYYVDIWKKAQEISGDWPNSREMIERMLVSDEPNLQLGGLYALMPHRDEAPARLLEVAKGLTKSTNLRVRLTASGFYEREEFDRIMYGILDEIIPEEDAVHAFNLHWEFRDPEDILASIAEILTHRDEMDGRAEEALCKIMALRALGSSRITAGRYLAKKRSRLAVIYMVKSVEGLIAMNDRTECNAFKMLSRLLGTTFPAGVYAGRDWKRKIARYWSARANDAEEILDPAKPFPRWRLPEDPFEYARKIGAGEIIEQID